MEPQKLYKQTATGATQVWYQEINGTGDGFRTVSGQLEGKLVYSEWTVCTAKNVGRANATTPQQQCLAEVEANYKKKLAQGNYKTSLDEDSLAQDNYIKPMLAKKFGEDYTPTAADYDKKIVYSQPKLDGCLHGDTLVQTACGDIPIKNIKQGIQVYSVNNETNQQELKTVIGVYKNGVDINDSKPEWFKITFENGQSITLTGNHRVWIDNLKCWRRVDNLDGTEELKLFHQI